MNQLSKIIISLLIFVCSTVLFAEETKDEDDKKTIKKEVIQETVLGMNVSGNKEAPNMLYIVPWKDNSHEAKPVELYRLMDEIYSTLDPEVFIKEVTYLKKINSLNKISSKSVLSQTENK
jgi:hypothetical protein